MGSFPVRNLAKMVAITVPVNFCNCVNLNEPYALERNCANVGGLYECQAIVTMRKSLGTLRTTRGCTNVDEHRVIVQASRVLYER